MKNKYDPKKIESKWQKIWADTGLYTANLSSTKPKYIAMSMFNYPSGAGIHVGHAMNYTISDVKARFKRQQGYESYHPVGWDAFGLPAENYAIKAGVSPQKSMAATIPIYHQQYKAMGWSNDWQKEISTHLPEYYKWTQWIFAQMYKQGLAYQATRSQWWCTKCQTVLANEQVIDGKCWRHDGPNDPIVQKRKVKQWFLKITAYADELLEAVDELEWTEGVKLAQKNWIGRSVGAEVNFKIKGAKEVVPVFTTRPDTLYGATFIVLAPEHDLLAKIVSTKQQKAVAAYVKASAQKSEIERQASKAKSGVFCGAYAINPVNKEAIPIWVADYVLMNYGSGAIMAVPAHDQRDFEFARQYDLPIKPVIEPITGEPQTNPEFRRSIVAIVRHPKTGKLLSINWGKAQGGHLFIGGGLEAGEDAVKTAIREITEETGYKNVRLMATSETVHHHYFAVSKNKPRQIEASGLFFELIDDQRTATKLEADEKGKFKIEWLAAEEADKKVTDPLHHYLLDKFIKQQVYSGEGKLDDSGKYTSMESSVAREKITKDLAKAGQAQEQTQYKMRDWSVSRQRYWGAPIPIINCPKCGSVLVPDKDLPVVLPELKDFLPSGDGRGALARAKDWLKVKCPSCNGPAERETDTLDTYLDSSWYMFRYFDPHNAKVIFDSKTINKWLPIDFYNGADHATAHLLYARFLARFFTKIGLIKQPEPFKHMLYNGKVTASDGSAFSKSKGTGADPLEIINSGYGADALRLYLMFAAPLELSVRWNPKGVPGTYRFLNRLWNLVHEYLETAELKLPTPVQAKLDRLINQMVKKITADLESNDYNTAIAAAMSALNGLYKLKAEAFGKSAAWQKALDALTACIAPFAPHISEELWQKLGHKSSVHLDSWPQWDAKLAAEELITIIVQINGKTRATFTVNPDIAKAELIAQAQAEPKVKKYLTGKKIVKTIVVPEKLINFVAQ